MKVVHLSTTDIHGGAPRAAHRLHQGLRDLGVDSYMLVETKLSDDPAVIGYESFSERAWAKLRLRLDKLPLRRYPARGRHPFSVQWVPNNVPAKVAPMKPDIINLHWICDAFVSVEAIARFGRPLVWTLHDMWPFTGGCHYDRDCGRYTDSCGACPQLNSRRERDLSRWTWRRKRRAWKPPITIVTPSRWLADCARRSSLFCNTRIEVIPNGVNLDRFKPLDKRVAREVFNLPAEKLLILFSAMNATTDMRKGFHLLEATLRQLDLAHNQDRIALLVMGASQPDQATEMGLPSHYLGQLRDEISVSLAYAAADVFVAPSRQDNLPNTVLEALACGLPCVAFEIGGMPDMIHHRQNGYLAAPFEVQDLAQGIRWVLADAERRQALSHHARQKVVDNFSQELQARRYRELYQDILAGRVATLRGETGKQ